MAVSFKKARDLVYGNGVLWEKALFGTLFEKRPIAQFYAAVLAYRNADGGYGHDLEHDIKCPDSHPLALEFLLSVLNHTGLPAGPLLDGTSAWVETIRQPDGALRNPASIHDYPLAPWWIESGGQTTPDSITGNLLKHGACSPALAASTKAWAQANLTIDHIRANEWLFMCYHANDYFMNVSDFPDLAAHQQATLDNITACAQAAPENQAYSLFLLAPSPEHNTAKAIPASIIDKALDYLQETQRDDGGWDDQHGLAQWTPYTTIIVLLALERYRGIVSNG